MKKKLIFKILLCLCLNPLINKGQNMPHSSKHIEITGNFYKYIPYYLHFSNNWNQNNLKIEGQSLILEKVNYYSNPDTNITTIRFNIREDYGVNLSITDTLLNEIIKMKMDVKIPPFIINYVSEGKTFNSGYSIKKEQILKEGIITCSVINFGVGLKFNVKKFNLTFFSNDKMFSYPSEGSSLSNEQITALKNLKEKTVIVFNDIVVEDYNKDEIRGIPPFVLFIK